MRRLVNALCKVYTDQASVMRIARDAGLDITRIAMPQTASVAAMWQAVLREAEPRGLLPRIFSVARGEYPEVEELYEAEFAYLTERHTQVVKASQSADPSDPNLMTMFGDIVAANVRLLKLEQTANTNSQKIAAVSDDIAAIRAIISQQQARAGEQRYTIVLLIVIVSAITSFLIEAAIYAVG